MEPENTIVDDDKQADLDLSAGFNLEVPPEPTAKIEPGSKIAKPEPQQEPSVEPPVASAPPAPEYVQITKEDFERLNASAAKTGDIEKQISRVFGTVGQMQQVVQRLQTATPSGQSIEIPKDAFAEIEKDYPEFAAQMRRELQNALKNVRGTGQAQTNGDGITPESLQALIQEERTKHETEALEDAHPMWREIVGVVDADGGHDANHPFRKWLAQQDAGYQSKINSTNSAIVIARSIDKFLASTKTAVRPAKNQAPNVAARDRIRGAIQPRGDGGQPAPAKSADDDFREGFASG